MSSTISLGFDIFYSDCLALPGEDKDSGAMIALT